MNTNFVGNQQKFSDNFTFVSEYFRLLTKYYHNWLLPNYKCTYYSLDIENSNIDKDKFANGSYEMIGDLSGWRWRKVLDFPINGIEALPTNPTIDERGVTNVDKTTSCWFPSSFQIEAHVHDFIIFSEVESDENYFLRNPPLFEVVNVERSPDFDNTFYKCYMKISYIPKNSIDKQIDGLFHYMNYEKKIYPIDNSILLNSFLSEREKTKINSFYNDNTGLYLDKINLLK